MYKRVIHSFSAFAAHTTFPLRRIPMQHTTRSTRRFSISNGGPRIWLLLFLTIAWLALSARAFGDGLIQPKVLVIATYETGKDRGDIPGELQFWAERQHLDQEI